LAWTCCKSKTGEILFQSRLYRWRSFGWRRYCVGKSLDALFLQWFFTDLKYWIYGYLTSGNGREISEKKIHD
jgi:hypothetical protein